MKSALAYRLGVDVKGAFNFLTWLVKLSSVLLNTYLAGKHRKTSHERDGGKATKMLGFEFGELSFLEYDYQADWENSKVFGRAEYLEGTSHRAGSTLLSTRTELTRPDRWKDYPSKKGRRRTPRRTSSGHRGSTKMEMRWGEGRAWLN